MGRLGGVTGRGVGDSFRQRLSAPRVDGSDGLNPLGALHELGTA